MHLLVEAAWRGTVKAQYAACLLSRLDFNTSACSNSPQRQRANRLLAGAVVDIKNARRRAKRPGRRPVKRRRSFRALAPLRMEATSSWSKWAEPRQHRLLRSHLSPPQGKACLYSRASSAKGLVLLRQVRICKAEHWEQRHGIEWGEEPGQTTDMSRLGPLATRCQRCLSGLLEPSLRLDIAPCAGVYPKTVLGFRALEAWSKLSHGCPGMRLQEKG